MLYLLQVSVCTLLFYLLYHFVFRQKRYHGLNRFYLLSALLLSFLIPLIQIPIFPEYVAVSNQPPVFTGVTPQAIPAGNFWNLKTILIGLYLFGVVLSLGLLLRGLLQVFSGIRKGQAKKCDGYTQVQMDKSFALSSFFNYLLLPQTKVDSITDYELTHELVHIRQKHSWDILILEITKTVLWFNPIVHAYKKRLVEVHEYLADAHAMDSFGKTDYQAFLIQQVSLLPTSSLIHNFYSLFKKRLHMINNSANSSRKSYWLIIPVLLIAASFFSFSSYKIAVPIENEGFATAQDTLPLLDTIVTFDPATGEEKIEVVETFMLGDEDGNNPKKFKFKRDPIVVVDTVIIHDPATDTETVQIVRMEKKHELDTITTFDPFTYKETTIVLDPNTGVIDTLRKEK